MRHLIKETIVKPFCTSAVILLAVCAVLETPALGHALDQNTLIQKP
jgi:hypothetical protein